MAPSTVQYEYEHYPSVTLMWVCDRVMFAILAYYIYL